LRSEINYLVLNPYWKITDNIARYEILPKIKKDISYLEKNNIKVLREWTDNSVISPDSINWDTITSEKFTYKLRQDPGPNNSLGKIKFAFPNDNYIFLHDTPARSLFDYNERARSHGCIRVEKPFALARYLLEKSWEEEKLNSILNSKKRKFINLVEPVPLYIVYYTAWVKENGEINYRDDIYNLDLDYYDSPQIDYKC